MEVRWNFKREEGAFEEVKILREKYEGKVEFQEGRRGI